MAHSIEIVFRVLGAVYYARFTAEVSFNFPQFSELYYSDKNIGSSLNYSGYIAKLRFTDERTMRICYDKIYKMIKPEQSYNPYS
jgi:hypothetical protein